MFKLFIFSLVSVALVYQALGGIISGKDDAKNAFHKLIEVVDKAVTEAQTFLNKTLADLKEEESVLQDVAKAGLDDVLDKLTNVLYQSVAEAEAKGFDISKCQNYIDDYENISENTADNLVNYTDQHISKAQDYIQDALNNATKIVQDLNSIDGEIDNCSGDKEEAKCYAKIIEEIAKDTKEAPQHISEYVSRATTLISYFLDDFETYALSQLKEAEDQGIADVANFSICAGV